MTSKLPGVFLAAALGVLGLDARAEPLATQGIGTSSCARLVVTSIRARD